MDKEIDEDAGVLVETVAVVVTSSVGALVLMEWVMVVEVRRESVSGPPSVADGTGGGSALLLLLAAVCIPAVFVP